MSCSHCDFYEILEQTRPPDPELVDLIEQAYIEGQIDSQEAELAYLCLLPGLREKKGNFSGRRGH